MGISPQQELHYFAQAQGNHALFANQTYINLPPLAGSELKERHAFSINASDRNDDENVLDSIDAKLKPFLDSQKLKLFSYAIGEAIFNAQDHNFNYDPSQVIPIELWINERTVTVAVQSRGNIELERLPHAIQHANSVDMDCYRGRGLQIMTVSSDAVFYAVHPPFIDVYLVKIR